VAKGRRAGAETSGSETPVGLELPHERDQSVSMTGGAPSEAVHQAHRDVERGLQDTDKGPPMDRAYRQLKKKP